jgi:uncharacterized protein (TIGR02453 family)
MPGDPSTARFSPEFFRFLRDLKRNNNRGWFLANKARFNEFVQGTSVRFVEAMTPEIHRINRNLAGDPRPVGGSLMRIYRDVRFSKDKSPYRTSMGIHFFHRDREGHEGGLPGLFLHLAPGESFVASGMWMPTTPDLAKIRNALLKDPSGWKRAKAPGLSPDENALKRVPPGFAPDHPLAEDLKRKSYVAMSSLKDSEVTSPGFGTRFIVECRRLDPLNRFLAKAVGVPY